MIYVDIFVSDFVIVSEPAANIARFILELYGTEGVEDSDIDWDEYDPLTWIQDVARSGRHYKGHLSDEKAQLLMAFAQGQLEQFFELRDRLNEAHKPS